jgi:hypothetical protein
MNDWKCMGLRWLCASQAGDRCKISYIYISLESKLNLAMIIFGKVGPKE